MIAKADRVPGNPASSVLRGKSRGHRRIPKWPGFVSCLLLSFACVPWGGCVLDKEVPPQESILRLSLNDSLRQYDSVVIVLVDPVTGGLLERVSSGPLASPSQLPPHALAAAKDRPFVVDVKGYSRNGQLTLHTRIRSDGTSKQGIEHVPVPALVPYNWLTRLSVTGGGPLRPAFNPDSLSYQFTATEGLASVSFDVKAAYSKAALVMEGEVAGPGSPDKVFPVGNGPDTFDIQVTDLGVARAYRVEVFPGKPPPVGLSRIEYSAGLLSPAFQPQVGRFFLELPAATASVELRFYVPDPRMSIIFLGGAVFPGSPRTVSVEPGSTAAFSIVVSLGTASSKDYTLEIRRAALP